MQRDKARAEQHAGERTDGCAARHAEHQGIGQRVAEQRLQQHAGQGQQRADGEGGGGARQPHGPDDQAAEVIAAAEHGGAAHWFRLRPADPTSSVAHKAKAASTASRPSPHAWRRRNICQAYRMKSQSGASPIGLHGLHW